MKIAFDLDGVLRQSRIGSLNMARQLKENINFDLNQWMEVESGTIFPQLTPGLLTQSEDEVYVITAVLQSKGSPLRQAISRKKVWVRHFFGSRIKVVTVIGNWNNGKDYIEPVVKEKLAVMHKLGIQVYFDDDPAIVRRMREVIKQHKWDIKVLRYGPWLEEYYDDHAPSPARAETPAPKTSMHIAFDLDGVLRQSIVGDLDMAGQIRKRLPFDNSRWYVKKIGTVYPQLDPWLFAQKNDKVFVISAVFADPGQSISHSVDRKRRWIYHFIGSRAKLVHVTGEWDTDDQYHDLVIGKKIERMQKLGIEVYFDDDPTIVRRMREIIKAQHLDIKVLRYGPWLDEEF